MSLIRRDDNAVLPSQRTGPGRVPTGKADEIVISEASFRTAHRAFERNQEPPAKRQKREDRGDSSVVYGDGAYKGPWRKYEEYRPEAASDDEEGEEVEYEEVYEEDEIEEMPAKPAGLQGTGYVDVGDGKETSEFLGSEEKDYQGRTYMHVPQDLNINLTRELPYEERKNFIPKKQIHTWKGHTKPITQARFFPDSGHLLLSAAADSKVLLWDVYHNRELLRSFNGHSKAVTDIDFSPSGIDFLSASFDRNMKLWDTETGTCKSRFTTGATPHVIRINPSSPHEFLAGMSDNKIVQFDMRSDDPKPVQEYDHHLGPVNTLTYCDSDRRFISTSDDKSLRAWEYGIPVPIKLVADPSMYSLVRAATHPSGRHVAFQSMDNSVVVYSAGDKFRQNRKKAFRGHNTAGTGCAIDISPDGQFLASGDTGGFVCFWDWKTCKLFHKILAAEGSCTTVAWHPREASRIVTGGTDGKLKYWD